MLNLGQSVCRVGAQFAAIIFLLTPFTSSAGPEDPAEGGAWGPLIEWPHIAVSAANLPDGRVLTWSGSERETWPTTEQTYSAVWDPSNPIPENGFVEVFHSTHNMFCAHLSMLEDGRVFVTGGRNQTQSPWTSIFDYRDDQWVQIENMATGGRWYPTTITLENGDVMTSIGTSTNARNPEVWNIDNGWQVKNGIDFNSMVLNPYFISGAYSESNWWPLMHVAPNGQVFHSGPTPQMHYINPSTNSATPVDLDPNGMVPDFYHKHGTSIMYDEGKILQAGGWQSGNNIASVNKAFTIDLHGTEGLNPTITATQPMTHARKFHNGVMLPTGEVLVIGGNTSGQKFSDNGSVFPVEIWDPSAGVNGEWRLGASMKSAGRNYHSVALLLADGRVLSAGSGYCSGNAFCGGASHKDGEIYSPPYLFDSTGNPAARPEIIGAPGKISSGEIFNVTATPGLDRFTMIRMGSTTHGMNTDVRFLNVAFSETSAGNYSLTANPLKAVLTPGYWMLFGLDSNGVPSVAHVVLANSSGMPWIAAPPDQSSQQDVASSFQVDAGDADNDPLVYSATGLPPGLSIDPASGLIDGAATSPGNYQVTVTVNDNDEGSRFRTFNWAVFDQGLGTIRRDWWTGMGGTAVADLTSNINYPESPAGTDFLTSFEAPTNWADNYGTRMYGYLTPTETGDYTFAIATDDGGELWLSTDANPSNKGLIAHVPGFAGPRDWNKFAEQQSSPISLTAGTTYYIEALQKEGGGGDNLAVAWQRPSSGSLEVIEGAYLSAANTTIGITADAKLISGTVGNLGDAWTVVTLPNSYNDMVVIATPQYDSAALPVVSRIRNASGNQFEIRVQNPSGAVAPSTYTVDYVVSEAGVFADSSIKMEAAKFDSSMVDNSSSWAGESRLYQHPYVDPVVVGQVMTANDARWSAFWASDGTAGNPPSASGFAVGRHIGEDTDTARAAETIGYIVIDSGSGLIGDVPFEAAVGSNIVLGMDDAPPYSYSIATSADTAVLSSAGMNGANGGWPVLYGSDPLATSQVSLTVDEDQISDSERSHTSEQIAYVAFRRPPLTAGEIQSSPVVAGTDVTYNITTTGGAGLLYSWNFGDNTGDFDTGTVPEATHVFAAPGRYTVVVTVTDPMTGEEVTETFIQIIHWPLTASAPSKSSSIALNESLNQVWSVNPDNNSVTVIDTVVPVFLAELATGRQPVSVGIAPNGLVWVVNRASANISVFDPTSLTTPAATIPLPSRSQPEGLAFDKMGNLAYVALEATGDLLKLDATSGTVIDSAYLGDTPRHVSVNWDGSQVLVSSFVTPPLPNEATIPVVKTGVSPNEVFFGARVSIVDPSNMNVSNVTLRHSDRGVSEHSGPGVPNYLGAPAISPDGRSAWVPSKQDNILAGGFRGGQGMTFDQTVRAITSKINLQTATEEFPYRVDHDNASVGSAAEFGRVGVYLFTALEGNREVAVSNSFTGAEIYRFDVGRAPQGLTISNDGNRLYIHNFMDRTVGIYDISEITQNNELIVTEIDTIGTVQAEALTPTVLLGKQLFYDSRDPRLALDSYMSCASCHNDGGHDGRVWDISTLDEGATLHEGVRNTISLEGRAALVHGFLHWTSNFDEVQDFEGQIRALAGGTGLMTDPDFAATSDPLGAPKAGLSPDLDAIAAYLGSLNEFPDSPYRNQDGTFTPDGESGKAVFEANNCATCHSAPNLTDSGDTVLHDVGTITPASGKRLGAALTGFDTPTLISLWSTGPYLHNGSAMDVTEAVSAHNGISLTTTELNQLGAYLEQLDAVTAGIVTICTNCVDFATAPTVSYGSQDVANNVTVSDGGATIRLDDNTWHRTQQTYTITPNTVLEFNFQSTSQGEVHGIGFDADESPAPGDWQFQIYGTQSTPHITDFQYSGSGSEFFQIPVGQYYTGNDMYLVLINDNDAGSGNNSTFSNIRIYENGVAPAAPVIDNPGNQSSSVFTAVDLQMTASDADGDNLTFSDPTNSLPSGLVMDNAGRITGVPDTVNVYTVTIEVTDGTTTPDSATFDWAITDTPTCPDCVDFTATPTVSYGSQDVANNVTVSDGGATIRLDDNTWHRTQQTYTITPNTVLEFNFQSTSQGEVHGIGFDADESPAPGDWQFQIYGTQSTPHITDFQYSGSGSEFFQIPVGQYYTGNDMYLVLINDNDAGSGNNSTFSNIRIYENGVAPAAPVIDNPGNQSSSVFTAVDLQMTASDADGDNLTFSDPTNSLPSGLVMDNAGRITGVPDTVNVYTVTIEVTDGTTTPDSATFDWTITDTPTCPDCVDFAATPTVSYGSEDVANNVTVSDGGATIRLDDNTWRRTQQTYTITPNTVLEFNFQSTSQGEVHGIGFDADESPAPGDWQFQIYGTQSTPHITDFQYSGSGSEFFQIPVGQYYTGNDMYLVLINDNDAGSGNNSTFSNIRIYENGVAPAAPVIDNPGNQSSSVFTAVDLQMTASDADGDNLTFSDPTNSLPSGLVMDNAGRITGVPDTVNVYTVTIEVTDGTTTPDSATFDWAITDTPTCPDCVDFTATPTVSYGSQDVANNVTVSDGGATIRLDDNTWHRTQQTYTITPNTVLEFNFQSTSQGEVHGIGFDADESPAPGDWQFQIYGTQSTPHITDFQYSGSGSEFFQIPVGQYYTGNDMYLVLINDNDAGSGNNSTFSNIRIYENGVAPAAPVIDNPGNQSSSVFTAVDLQMTASDADGDNLTFSDPTNSLPSGLVMDNAGRITGVPDTVNVYTVTIEVTDGTTTPDSATFDWAITDTPTCPDCVDFTATPTVSYGSQDVANNVTVSDGGATIRLDDNTWHRTQQTYTITPNTVLEFNFQSTSQGEVHGIGFDADESPAPGDWQFQIYGTQSTPHITDFQYSGSGSEFFQIPVGQYYTGNDMYLVLINDNDAGSGNNSTFSNIRIFESGAP